MTKSVSNQTANFFPFPCHPECVEQDCNMCKQDRDWFKGLLCPNKHPMSTHICVHHLDWAGIEIETMSSFLLFKSKLEQKQTKRNISNLLSPLQSKAKYIWIYCNLASTFKSDDSFSSTDDLEQKQTKRKLSQKVKVRRPLIVAFIWLLIAGQQPGVFLKTSWKCSKFRISLLRVQNENFLIFWCTLVGLATLQ